MKTCLSLLTLFVMLSFFACATTAAAEMKITIKVQENSVDAIPAGILQFFNLPQCPPGWSEVAVAQGRFLVALNSNGTSGAVVGTALSDQENRTVGQHTHAINDTGHTHNYYNLYPNMPHMLAYATPIYKIQGENIQTSVSTTGITLNNTGTTAGTHSPYIQLLLCKYNGFVAQSEQELNSNTHAPSQDEFPPGAITFFNETNCPPGWADYAASNGRYIVSLPSGGVLGAAVGTALADKENRPVGQHTHNINDPGHSHATSRSYPLSALPYNAGGNMIQCTYQGACTPSGGGISVLNSGSISGTNAPYIQLLTCQAFHTGPGKILNTLMINKNNGYPLLTWETVSGTCLTNGYAVYRGTLPFTNYNHEPLNCAVEVTNYLDDFLPSDSYYYLVLSKNDSNEGSCGTDSAGNERPQSINACYTQDLIPCN